MDGFAAALRPIDRGKDFHRYAPFAPCDERVAPLLNGLQEVADLQIVVMARWVNGVEGGGVFSLPLRQQVFLIRDRPQVVDGRVEHDTWLFPLKPVAFELQGAAVFVDGANSRIVKAG